MQRAMPKRLWGAGLCLLALGQCFAAWENLFEAPSEWLDYRHSKPSPRFPDFRRKEDGEGLWLGSSTPPWVEKELKDLGEKSKWPLGELTTFRSRLWSELFESPGEWGDYRQGKINPKFPDFKRHSDGKSLWADPESPSTPKWVIDKLEQLGDNTPWTQMSQSQGQRTMASLRTDTGSSDWDSLFNSPGEWLDYRQGKINPKFPDFKHESNGTPLWVERGSTPEWVHERLNELGDSPWTQAQQKDSQARTNGKSTKNSPLWTHLFDSPEEWEDFRHNKPVPRFPDFKHKEGGQALWVDSFSTPDWVPEKLVQLQGLQFGGRGRPQQRAAGGAKDILWKDLFESPNQWRDHRDAKKSGRVKPNYPDFKRLGDFESLWIDSRETPDWVHEKLLEGDLWSSASSDTRSSDSSSSFSDDPVKPCDPEEISRRWKSLFEAPMEWRDYRYGKKGGDYHFTHPDFRHEKTGEGVWCDESAPDWAMQEIQKLDQQVLEEELDQVSA